MSYICTSCGSVISNQQFIEYQKTQKENKGCGCFLFGLACLFCISIILIPVAILLFMLINKKENISECPNCHVKNCLIPSNTPMARKILKENYTNDEIKEFKEKEASEINQPQTKKIGFMGCVWWIIGLYIIALVIGLISSIK